MSFTYVDKIVKESQIIVSGVERNKNRRSIICGNPFYTHRVVEYGLIGIRIHITLTIILKYSSLIILNLIFSYLDPIRNV